MHLKLILLGCKCKAVRQLSDHIMNKSEFYADLNITMVYIVFVNPQILGAAQMDPKVVFVTTCLIAGIGSIAARFQHRRSFKQGCPQLAGDARPAIGHLDDNL